MPTQIDTFTVVAGNKACNARCPFCVSRMTGFEPVVGNQPDKLNERNFVKAAHMAQQAGAQTMLITGKGEPTLFPDDVTQFLEANNRLQGSFPIVEIQTNALQIGALAAGNTKRAGKLTREVLELWYQLGLDTIAISTVGSNPLLNHEVYCGSNPLIQYPDLGQTVAFLHSIGFTVRVCVMYRKGGVDSYDAFVRVCKDFKDMEVDQLTFRNLARPYSSDGKFSDVEKDVIANRISDIIDEQIFYAVAGTKINIGSGTGKLLRTLTHGAHVFDVDGQNVCLTDCLNDDQLAEQGLDLIRSLIYYRDGRVTYSWQYEGAVIFRGSGG